MSTALEEQQEQQEIQPYFPSDATDDTATPTPAQAEQADPTINPGTGLPWGAAKVQIVVIATGKTDDEVNTTLDSLRAQSYADFQCTVCDPDNRPLAVSDSRISISPTEFSILTGLEVVGHVIAGVVMPTDAIKNRIEKNDISGFLFQPPVEGFPEMDPDYTYPEETPIGIGGP